MRRFTKTGHLPAATRTPHYGDFTGANDLQEAIELLDQVEAAFMELPAAVRQAAENSPVVFEQMLATPEGVQILESAGLGIDHEAAEHLSAPGSPQTVPPPSPPADLEAPAEGPTGDSGASEAPSDPNSGP